MAKVTMAEQPRVPAGDPKGGQWTSSGASTGRAVLDQARIAMTGQDRNIPGADQLRFPPGHPRSGQWKPRDLAPDIKHLARENKIPAKISDVPAGGKGVYGGDPELLRMKRDAEKPSNQSRLSSSDRQTLVAELRARESEGASGKAAPSMTVGDVRPKYVRPPHGYAGPNKDDTNPNVARARNLRARYLKEARRGVYTGESGVSVPFKGPRPTGKLPRLPGTKSKKKFVPPGGKKSSLREVFDAAASIFDDIARSIG